jgi:FtsH-binding integral membrane protein
MEQTLSRTLLLVGVVFFVMTVIGIVDKGNMVSWESYLFAGLLGILVASIGFLFVPKQSKEAHVVSQWLHWGIVILFTLL